MALKQDRSRVHLLAAKKAPTLVILQHKRAELFHVITVNTQKRWIDEGSWFRGELDVLRSDVSFDGKFMVYLTIGANGRTWNGICRLPCLTMLVEVENIGAWYGGGHFSGQRLLKTNGWRADEQISTSADIPFTLEPYKSRHGGEDLGVLYERLERDGFTRLGESWGEQQKLATRTHQVVCHGDDGWARRVSHQHPQLALRYSGFLGHGHTFAFTLDEYPGLLDGASWATWDPSGNLWVARPGVVEQFTLKDLERGIPSFSIDVDGFEEPANEELPRRAGGSSSATHKCIWRSGSV